MSKYFITGIGTDVGKTVVSAIVVEALHADYWKPIQAGELHHTDRHSVEELISNSRTVLHRHSYALKTPMSPHAAADIDGVKIVLGNIKEPKTDNNLVIEGAGGLLVPINETQTILDLIKEDYKVIVVSRHYLGSINHTLLTLDHLKSKGIKVAGIVFNGKEHPTTEEIILKMAKVHKIGRIDEELELNKEVVSEYAKLFKSKLESL